MDKMALLKLDVYRTIVEAYSLMGKGETINMYEIPFPDSLVKLDDETELCWINAYGLFIECRWNSFSNLWDIQYEVDELNERRVHVVDHL